MIKDETERKTDKQYKGLWPWSYILENCLWSAANDGIVPATLFYLFHEAIPGRFWRENLTPPKLGGCCSVSSIF